MADRDIFKVIKIIDDKRILIDAGSMDSINRGAQLEIFVKGKSVKNPETGEDLGALDPIKAYVTVTNVYPKMAVCMNSETVPPSGKLAEAMGYDKYWKLNWEPQRLNITSKEISGGWLSDDEEKIRVGDTVRYAR